MFPKNERFFKNFTLKISPEFQDESVDYSSPKKLIESSKIPKEIDQESEKIINLHSCYESLIE